MRLRRITLKRGGCYHVVDRIVDRVFRLNTKQKNIFIKIMHKVMFFCGAELLTYCIMDNHFHILIRFPESQGILDEAELVRRMNVLYGVKYTANRQEEWRKSRELGQDQLVDREHDRLRARMGNLSALVKTLKQRYSICYNRNHDRVGTLWEGRFKSTVIENQPDALNHIAAYIDLNPIRAGIVDDPKDYRWSGYGSACGGKPQSRDGIIALHHLKKGKDGAGWKKASAEYRKLLYLYGEQKLAKTSDQVVKRGFSKEKVEEVWRNKGRLSIGECLRCRVRYFTDGVAFGSTAFVESIFEDNRDQFSAKRESGARKMRLGDWGELRTLRDLRVNPLSVSDPAQA